MALTERKHRVGIVCHKGANHLAPENTLAAARLCVAWGVDYVEIDVHTARDGVLVLFHGPNLQRTTNGSGWVGALSAAELDELDAGSWFSPAFAGERIPRLAEFLSWLHGKAKVFIDVKNAEPRQLSDLVIATGFRDDCFFWSFDPDWMHRLHELEPGLALKVNVKTSVDAVQAKAEFDARIVETSLSDLTPQLLETCHGLGQQVMVIYSGNDPDIFQRIIASGADLINTDYGDEFLLHLDKTQSI
jgi:glycerophosphoryl diester phosphodiesterase